MLHILALSVLLLASPVLAQEADTPPPAPEEKAAEKTWATVPVILTTSLGPITLELESERAPKTTENFLKYAAEKRFDGTSFYRAVTFPERPDLGLIQGGIESDPKRSLPPVAHEPTSETGLSHDNMAISMARGAPDSATGDFFIIIGGLPGLDANPQADGDNQGFAVFGHVTEGSDVVQQILTSPTAADKGEGSMKGQILAQPIRIISVRRAD